MSECRHCRKELDAPGECEDRAGCRKRAAANVRKTASTMKTPKHGKTWEQHAYEQAMGR